MNKYFEFAISAEAEKWVAVTVVIGFIFGCLKEDWATGIAYGIFAPLALIPLVVAIFFTGLIYEFIKPKSNR